VIPGIRWLDPTSAGEHDKAFRRSRAKDRNDRIIEVIWYAPLPSPTHLFDRLTLFGLYIRRISGRRQRIPALQSSGLFDVVSQEAQRSLGSISDAVARSTSGRPSSTERSSYSSAQPENDIQMSIAFFSRKLFTP